MTVRSRSGCCFHFLVGDFQSRVGFFQSFCLWRHNRRGEARLRPSTGRTRFFDRPDFFDSILEFFHGFCNDPSWWWVRFRRFELLHFLKISPLYQILNMDALTASSLCALENFPFLMDSCNSHQHNGIFLYNCPQKEFFRFTVYSNQDLLSIHKQQQVMRKKVAIFMLRF